MVSAPHEAMHRIFQHDPGLFSRVSRILGIPLSGPVVTTVMPTDLTEASPVERRVDTLLRLETPEQGAFLLAIEAQGKKDPDKPASWAYYTAFLWTKYRLPTCLMVVCQDRATAQWAQRTVYSGLPQMPTVSVRPTVVGPHNMPVITDPAEARADLALATLAAITHAAEPDIDVILKALSTALRDTPQDIADPIVEFTAQGLGNRPAKHLWRNLVAVDLSFYKSYISEEIRDEGRAQSRAEDLLLVLEERGLDVSDDVRRRITECREPETLRRWLSRAVTAPKAEEIFEEE
ncbi:MULTISPECIES: hypothetical protein [Streptomyces]|uniref:Transposase (putative) YhgA-like domain-containing protein n=1 Tax=Streptomyces griseoaurantiacus M045 TaxID=996637 RepID=F3NIZ4_9ACTN|nr:MULTISPECIES: hypothetical protein [Streptomyces]EGG46619.1 hypothetical protein SGM_3183 [Streptomyces griseoaurantiacus M045]NJP71821.1 hypothetical protein [Streptomyces sp. C1-2]